jgi:hypothetical protein
MYLDIVKLALMMMPVRSFNNNPAFHDTLAIFIQLPNLIQYF